MRYPLALLLTLLVETPVNVAALTLPSWRRTVAASIAVNLLTHPLAWWLIGAAPPGWYWPAFALVETAVMVTEAELLHRLLRVPRLPGYAAALTANAASALTGILLATA